MVWALEVKDLATGVMSIPTEDGTVLCLVWRQPGFHHLQSDLIYPAFGFRVDVILKRKEKITATKNNLAA